MIREYILIVDRIYHETGYQEHLAHIIDGGSEEPSVPQHVVSFGDWLKLV